MRKLTVLLALLPFSSACFDLDLTGLDFCSEGCGLYTPPPPTLSVEGSVTVGPYQAMWDEVSLLVYAPADTVEPVDSVPIGGDYYVDLGQSPAADACDYLARAVLWTGERTELKPLFASSEPCGVSTAPQRGSDFEFADYAPLDVPFTVGGQVRLNGAPASPDEVVVTVFLRPRQDGSSSEVDVSTDDDGRFRYETTEGAERFWFCSGAGASVRRADREEWIYTGLGFMPDETCPDEIQLPDVRIGTTKAANGRVFVDDPAVGWVLVGAGEARVALLDPADSTVVGEEFETLVDGSFHVWFPDDLEDPGCDWLVRAELVETGEVEIQRLQEGGPYCYPDIYREFVFDG